MQSKFSFLFQSTSLHGFKYLAHQDVSWKNTLSRIFWTTFILIATLFMAKMLNNMLDKLSTSTTINLDTSYKDWENSFPAVSVCLAKGHSTTEIKNYLGSHFIKPDGTKVKFSMRHYRNIQSYLFLNYIEPLEGLQMEYCSELNETCGIDFDTLKNALLPKSCKEIMDKMFYLEKEVDCEDYFDKFETEIGLCFSANSLFSNGVNGKIDLEDFGNLKMKYSNQQNFERSLEIHYKGNKFYSYKLFIHTPEELPDGRFLTYTDLRKIGDVTFILIKTVEFHNHPDVKHEPIEARLCRFPSERFDTMNLPYSLNYCKYLKRVKMEMDYCNCTLPVGFKKQPSLKTCNLTQFDCPDELAKKIGSDMKDSEKVKKNIGDCLNPSCVSMEINRIGQYEKKFNASDNVGAVKIEILDKPTLRYVRRVSFSRLDIIVQFGGIIGLFFGASFLSILEIFYLIYRMLKI